MDNEIWSVRENVDEPTFTDADNILKDNEILYGFVERTRENIHLQAFRMLPKEGG